MADAGRNTRSTTAGRWKLRLAGAGLAYGLSLALILAIGPAPEWSTAEIVLLYPAVGMLVGAVLLGAIYEIFAIDLPVLLDTFRFFARKLLPRRLGKPVSAALTRWWARTPSWMRHRIWMSDDESHAWERAERDRDA